MIKLSFKKLVSIILIKILSRAICLIFALNFIQAHTQQNLINLSNINPDLTIIGPVKFEDGLGRLPITISQAIKDQCDILIIPSNHWSLEDLEKLKDKNIKVDQIENISNVETKICLLTDILWSNNFATFSKLPKSKIKIAYSMLEATAIPKQWTLILNNFFDAVIVPDQALVKVYNNSGVDIPIFVVPPILALDDFLNVAQKEKPNKIFTFGMSAGFWPRKNHKLLIEAFSELFKNNPKVQLKLHGRFGDNKILEEINKLITDLKLNNVILETGILKDKDYQDFITSLDCYVFVSAGEGFSITPREAIAAGIPCILSNNTAHQTICQTGLVKSVNCRNIEAADYKTVFNSFIGFQFSPIKEEVKKALKEVYNNYDKWLKKAKKLRNWIKQYQPNNLAEYYLSLVKPKKISFSSFNQINNNGIATNSPKFLKKYKMLYPLLEHEREKDPDLTIFGIVKFADGLGRLPIAVIDSLKDDLDINFVISRKKPYLNTNDIPQKVVEVIQDNKFKYKLGKKIFFTDLLSVHWDKPYSYVPQNNSIKIAYTMVESDKVPKKWVNIINNVFDAIVVPDQYLSEIYKNSGVKKPIFTIPVAMYLDDFLKEKPKEHKNKIFTFGCSAGFWARKNHTKLIKAFAAAFGNHPNFRLKIHARAGENSERRKVYKLIDRHKLTNVDIIDKSLTQDEYIKFLQSLDCYVFLSKGEGFSLTPREALALGIPCVLSDNTGQKTICKSGYVKVVPSNIAAPAYYSHLKQYSGYDFDCKTEDAAQALQEIFTNYDLYLAKAKLGREWVKQYSINSIKNYYSSLLNPKNISLGNNNQLLLPNSLITNSKDLFNKYKNLNTKK